MPPFQRARLPAFLFGLAFGLTLVAAIVAVMAVAAVAASGVLARRDGDWTVPVQIGPRWTVQANAAGLVRLATSPLGRRLLDGRSFDTRHGPIAFQRDGRALLVRCAPCRVQHERVAPVAVGVPQATLRLSPRRTSGGNTLDGTLESGAVVARFVAQLQASGVRVEWTLPPTPAADLVRLFGDTVPEARQAGIDGTLAATGQFELPSRRSAARVYPRALAVDGLATELLQHGAFPFVCPLADGRTRQATTGDGEPGWRGLDTLGSLPGAVVAALEARVDANDVALPLTQHLARALYVRVPGERRPASSLAERVRVALYAIEMERTLSRDRIVALALNTAPWGPGVCGARAAARTYFRKTPAQLTPLESAWLASILEDPVGAWREQFVARRPDPSGALRVLARMPELTRAERQRWAGRSLTLAAPPATRASLLATGR
jgi:hypothetical protein